MANKVYNMDGGLHSSAALGALEDAMYGSSVASSSSFVCSAGTGMNVSISTGDGLISTGTGFARRIGTDAVNTVAISAASTASPRIDSIVAYIDNSVTPTETVLNNTNDILKFKSVTGTAAANPVAPSANTVQSSVGAGNPYMVLYNVRVPANATSLTSATFTDMRNIANEVTSNDIADGAVTSAKLDNSNIFMSAATLSQDKSISASTKTTVQSFSLPAGTWRISWGVRAFGASSNNEIVYGGLTVASADAQALATNVVSIGGTFRVTISNVYDATLNSTTTVSTVITMPAGYASKDGSYLKAIRIA